MTSCNPRYWVEWSGVSSPQGVTCVQADGGTSASPVDVPAFKVHMRTDATDASEDTEMAAMLAAATELVEAHTGRGLVEAQWRQGLDAFPDGFGIIELRRNPVRVIDSIVYEDDAGSPVTVDAAEYRLQPDASPARLFPKREGQWPYVSPEPGRVVVLFKGGYVAGKCPPCAIQAVKLLAGHFYENREGSAPGPDYDVLWQGLRRILAPIWIPAL